MVNIDAPEHLAKKVVNLRIPEVSVFQMTLLL